MTLPQATQTLSVMSDTADLPEAAQTALARAEELMLRVVDSDVHVLRDASRHILAAGGKRIRPKLVVLSCLAVGGEPNDDILRVAAAVELVHTASVVHDDINDHGVLRRGRPSVNAIWGRTFALLTGDFLFTKVYELMAPLREMNVPFAEATMALVEGETLQAAAVKDNNFTREVYYQIIARKTAALFRAAAYMGAVMSNDDLRYADALSNYGFNIGLAFQIVDDVLDIVGEPEKLGKTSGIDLAQGRGFAAAYNAEPVVVDNGDPMEAIKRKMMNTDTLNDARIKARVLVDSAIDSLDVLPNSEAKSALIDLAYSVIDREF
ncbi:MAG: polyprenyl synthetase family protein [Chloroflexota bacterium]|nr:polyprenyl synthetase family protein [Chloroflexota bacterium]